MNNNYPVPVIVMHWTVFILVVISYLTRGDPTEHGWIGQVHVMNGILIFVLSFIRLGLIFFYRQNLPKNKIINKYQQKAFIIVKYILYTGLFVVPIAGWVALSSLVDSYDIGSLSIPLLKNIGGIESVGEVHEILGNTFVTIVGLHACAALIHHFIFKDNVLKSMFFKKKIPFKR